MVNSILLVCTGNICRSPMAEGMLRAALDDPGVEIVSAGVAAPSLRPASEHAVTVLQAHGVDISGHRSTRVQRERLVSWGLILTAERSHASDLVGLQPAVRGRVFRLGHWLDVDIPDPIGLSIEAYEDTYRLLQRCIESWIPHLRPQKTD